MPVKDERTLTSVELSPSSEHKILRVEFSNLTKDIETGEVLAVNEKELFSFSDDIFSCAEPEKHNAALLEAIPALEEFIGIYKNHRIQLPEIPQPDNSQEPESSE